MKFWFYFVNVPYNCYFGLNLCSGIQETLPRLTAMVRGIGDPLVAAYTRAYLCRVRQAHIFSCTLDFCFFKGRVGVCCVFFF